MFSQSLKFAFFRKLFEKLKNTFSHFCFLLETKITWKKCFSCFSEPFCPKKKKKKLTQQNLKSTVLLIIGRKLYCYHVSIGDIIHITRFNILIICFNSKMQFIRYFLCWKSSRLIGLIVNVFFLFLSCLKYCRILR